MLVNPGPERVMLYSVPEGLPGHRGGAITRKQGIAGPPLEKLAPSFPHVPHQPINRFLAKRNQAFLVALANNPDHPLAQVHLIHR